MKRIVLAATLALSFAVPAVAFACEGHNQNAKTVKKLSVTELAALQKDAKVSPVDANGTDTRTKYGVIPGAVLLTSAVRFDAAKELPAQKDAKLVFYCANTQCSASQQAAEKALEAGYTDVSILPDGIMGWKQAGQKTASPAPRS